MALQPQQKALARDMNPYNTGGIVHEGNELLKQLEDIRLTLRDAGYDRATRDVEAFGKRVEALLADAGSIAEEYCQLIELLGEFVPDEPLEALFEKYESVAVPDGTA